MTTARRMGLKAFEVWVHPNPDVTGGWLPSCVPAGAAGALARQLSSEIFGPGHCVWLFWASTDDEAMVIYGEVRESMTDG